MWMMIAIIGAQPLFAAPLWEGPPPTSYELGTTQGYITPDILTVHQKETLNAVFPVGSGGMRVGDVLRLEDPLFHGIRVAKWALLTTDPSECTPIQEGGNSFALITAQTTGSATLSVVRSTASLDIHDYATTDIMVVEGVLEQGDEIVVTIGDVREGADCGFQTPPRSFHEVPWRGWVWDEEEQTFSRLHSDPVWSVYYRQEATSLHVVLPSMAMDGEKVRLKVAVLDEFGNAVESFSGVIQIEQAWGGEEYIMTSLDGGWHDFELTAKTGVVRVTAVSGELEATSNPMLVTEEAPPWRVYWGDIHAHHGHSVLLEDGTLFDENIHYGRDVVGLDVTSESMKGRPIEIDGKTVYAELVDNCNEHTVPGSFVSLLGFEWTALDHGHNNVYYDDCEGQLGHMGITSLAEEGGLWWWLDQQRESQGTDAVAIPHASLYTGFDWFRSSRVDPTANLEWRRVVEIYSAWGNSMEPSTEEGSVPRGLTEGVRASFVASSDNHLGWMGNALSSEKSVMPGLAAFVTPNLTTAGIFGALRDRATYATSGQRILVDYRLTEDGVSVEQGGDHLGDSPTFSWSIHGTAPIETVRLVGLSLASGEVPFTLYEENPRVLDVDGSFELGRSDWSRSTMAVWLEVIQDDGELAWGSPLYIEDAGCGCSTTQNGALWAPLAFLGVLVRRKRRALR
jgi:MYXO-CTERM domain-containing protein